MAPPHFLETRLALEWWRASGERSLERLLNLATHYCISYARSAEHEQAVAAECVAEFHRATRTARGEEMPS